MGRKFITYNGVIVGNGGLTLLSTETDTPTPPSFTNTKSILLDGVDDYVEAKSTTLGLDTAISISLWVKTTQSTSGFKQLIGEYDWGNSSKRNWLLYLSNVDNRIAFLVFSSGSIPINTFVLGADANIDDGNWHHVMVTWDGTTNTNSFNMFFDGVNVKQGTPTSTGIRTSDAPLYIGDGPNGNVEFEGNIDEVAIWNNDQSANASAIYNSGVPNDISSLSPLSWWRCGDGDTSPTLTDNGSGGNNGTMTNFTTFSTDTPTPPSFTNTKSILLDGVDDYVNVGSSSLGITSAISVSAWVKIPTTNTGGGGTNIQVIACEDTTSSGQRNWNMFWRGTGFNYFGWAIHHTNLSSSSVTTTGITPNDGQWHHLLGTYDGTTNSNGIKLYVDGVLNVQGTAGSTGLNSFSSSEPTIGALTNGSAWRLEGNIDEVAVWNSDRNADASTIYNNGVPNDISSLSPLSWWRCGDGDTAPTLTDNGSGGNDGTMTNFTNFSTDVP